jgi:hypothetical protein
MVSVDAPRFSDHFVEDVAFRAAWITLAQVPLVHLLATKRGPLNVLAGVSYERINWIHRSCGRVLFLSATIHMGIMLQSVSVMDIFKSPDKVMIIVQYGVGAYGMLTWIALSSILPVRRWSYRAFYTNHWVSTLVFLWVLFKHIPKYARSAVYISIGIILVDKCLFCYSLVRNNVCIRTVKRKCSQPRKGPSRKAITIGYPVKMTAPIVGSNFTTAKSTTIIRICDLPFSWKPGQHVRLYLPKLGSFEVHPFTPAMCSLSSTSPTFPREDADVENERLLGETDIAPSTNEMLLMIRAHSGLTQRLADYHSKWLCRPCPNASRPSSSLTAIIDGPYGAPPAWEEYENITLISTSTGVAFPLSIMHYLERICMEDPSRLRTQRIQLVWTVRHLQPQFDATVTELLVERITRLRQAGLSVTAEFYATCRKSGVLEPASELLQYDQFAHLRGHHRRRLYGTPPLRIWNPDKIYEATVGEQEFDDANEVYSDSIEQEESDADERCSFESNASSTLIDDNEEEEEEDEDEEDGEAPVGSFWTQFASQKKERRKVSACAAEKKDGNLCNCALVQSQRNKWNSQASASILVERFYGSRPNISRILKASTANTEKERVMVAACANQDMMAQARNVVARLNFDFVAGRRKMGVNIFTEGFS